MGTAIFIKQNGEYFAWKLDFSEQLIDGVREQGCFVDRTEQLEPVGLINIIMHKLFPKKEFHAIIAKRNRIHEIEAEW